MFTLPLIILPYTGLPYMRNLAWIVINITSFLPYIMFALPFIILPYTCLPYMWNLVRIVIIITPKNFKFVTGFCILPLWLLLRLSSMFIFTSPYYLFYLSTYLYTAWGVCRRLSEDAHRAFLYNTLTNYWYLAKFSWCEIFLWSKQKNLKNPEKKEWLPKLYWLFQTRWSSY